CKPFADALSHCGNFDTIHQDVDTQLESLLIAPWKASKLARCAEPSAPSQFLIIIDALDEIDGHEGFKFLRSLLNVIHSHHLQDIKFFVTSRREQALETHVNSFTDREFYHLEWVSPKEAQADIRTYLSTELPSLHSDDVEKLVTTAAGLFIYAATITKYLAKHHPQEQRKLIEWLSGAMPSHHSRMTALLDNLYHQILSDAFGDFEEEFLLHRQQVLFTLLCTAVRTSTLIVSQLLEHDNADIADEVVQHLHAVLYVEDNKVFWYHKSFADFLFDKTRSKKFWCHLDDHHRLLTRSCFQIMKKGLQFNVASIPSSFIFNKDNPALVTMVEQRISPTLGYSCQHWHYHLLLSMSNSLESVLKEFLQLHALFWIEAMNLMGLDGLCEVMLQTASKAGIQSALANHFAEAARFALYFSGSAASLSTPHLYISALATWPSNQEPCRTWRSHFPRIPAFENVAGNEMSLMTIQTKSGVTSVAFSSDGSHIISGSDDHSVQVWNASTGQEQKVLEGWHTNGVTSVAFSSDGSQTVSGSGDHLVRLWDASTGQGLKVLEGHTYKVTLAAFSSDGSQIVSGSEDDSVRVWDASTGQELKVLEGHTHAVTSVAFSSDGSRIVSGSWDKS
ncbi:hypothetical protein H0H93_010738, partial [Arthromyces matolae]